MVSAHKTGKVCPMRYGLIALALLAMSGLSSESRADSYPWCAVYGAQGTEYCYFKSLEECRAATFGNSGVCSPNARYVGNDNSWDGRVRRTFRY
jgi:hypothetical protein